MIEGTARGNRHCAGGATVGDTTADMNPVRCGGG